MIKKSKKRHILFYSLLGSFALHALFLAGLNAYGLLGEPPESLLRSTVELLRPVPKVPDIPVEKFSQPGASENALRGAIPSSDLKGADDPKNVAAIWREDQDRELSKFKTAAEKKLFLTYYELLSLSIRHNVVYPRESIERGEAGVVYLVFMLDRQGNLKDLKLRKGTGLERLDEAALEAIRLSAPFAPFPGGLKQEMIDFYVPIQFKKNS